ncbi:DUF368 domain-containing protein [Tissierella creatinini]|nr:DUF368 domain-containing protein [Tissierella creatinini]TJX66732.1 DUF368 domain-containing protein [Soehngenia saccharolytica]
MMSFIKDFFKGLIIGMGAVAPGVSGGTFAVMLGVYTKLTESLANIYHDFKRKMLTLFPLGLGIGAGFLLFSRVMEYLFEYHEFNITLLFIGLMLGTMSTVIKEANKKGFKRKYLIPCILAFSITILFMILENKNVINVIPDKEPGIIAFIIYGIIIGFGTIVPGISSSFILIYIGAYKIIIEAVSNFNLNVIVPVGISALLSILIFAKLINYMFSRFYGYTYYAIIGFVSGSIVTILPMPSSMRELLLGVLICTLGYIASYSLSKIGKK